jgi:Protein of unknown function (Hypoth_ymh)/Resolvase, N terminal domain
MHPATTGSGEPVVSEQGIFDPILVLGPLITESKKSEQKGFANLLVGLFGAVRNPLAHVNWARLKRFIAGCQPPTKPVPVKERDLRAFAKKARYKIVGVWKEIASGAKQERTERKKVLALPQARKVDVILVTELIRWGRSARFAAQSYRGRDIHCWMPPAQIPAGVIHAPGSRLGWLTTNPTSSFAYTVEPLGHVYPAQCPARVLLSHVPLGPLPWLHQLRPQLPRFVRRLQCYYEEV